MRTLYLAVAILLGLGSTLAAHADTPVLRIAVLKFGTVNWLMETVTRNGLDRAEGYRLEVIGLAGSPATTIAFQSGDADMLVKDWIWALRQREGGADVRFSPYSTALGALMTRGDVAGLCDLKGRRIGIVGGKLDKSWLLFQARARSECGFELADVADEVLFGAPPLMSRQLDTGDVDAVSTYWHWAARMEAGGKTRMLGVTSTMASLGIDPAPAFIGFIWDTKTVDAGLASAFLASVSAARRLLLADDAAWEPLRKRMKASDDRTFTLLRDRFREGVPAEWTDGGDRGIAARLHAVLVQEAPPAFPQAGRHLRSRGLLGPLGPDS